MVDSSISDFWFGCSKNEWDRNHMPANFKALMDLWFGSSTETDKDITSKFAHLFESEEPLAPSVEAIILYDQMSRNIFRGQAKAFAWDEKARVMSKELEGKLFEMPAFEAYFTILPLMHSEKSEDGQRCVDLV